MTTQSIIVYRNPLEQAIWEGQMGGEIVPIMSGIILGVIVMLLTDNIISWDIKKRFPYLSLYLGGIVGVFTIWKMWI